MSTEVLGICCGLAVLLVFMVSGSLTSGESKRDFHLVATTSTYLGYYPNRAMNPGWSNVPSLLSCAVRTIRQFSSSRGFLYNNGTGLCTPLFWITSAYSPVTEEEGLMYLVLDVCPADFTLVEMSDGSLYCVRFSGYIVTSYEQATSDCNSWGGHLAAVKSMDKLSLVRSFTVYNGNTWAWVGLDDIGHAGTFVWQIDDTNLTGEQRDEVFDDLSGPFSGDCVAANEYLDSIPCDTEMHFMCEILLP